MRFFIFRPSDSKRLGIVLGFASLVSVGLFVVGALRNDETEFVYLIWNLFLAWIPLGIGLWLTKILKHKLWSSWKALLVTLLWVVFLPNSFYMISDFIHVQEMPRVDLLYDVVMFTSFILNGVILGFLSLYMIHHELLKRVKWQTAARIVVGILALCSFAIYLGRDLRWNSWDMLVNPGGILIDVSDMVLYPSTYPRAASVTLSFFILLGSLYMVVWQAARSLSASRSS